MNDSLIRTFSSHYRQKYQTAIGKIPLDLHLVCPNRAHGGCIFCRPASFTPHYLNKEDSLRTQIDKAKKYLIKGRFLKFFAYFQQETVTAMAGDALLDKLEIVLGEPDCVGVILSTRPDYIFTHFLNQLADLIHLTGKECLIEIGLQSIHEKSLQLLNRNHTVDDFTSAFELIDSMPDIQTGVHLLFGIPGESQQDMIKTVTYINSLGIDALKLHHLQIVEGTPLHRMYLDGEVSLFSKKGYMDFLLKVIPLISKNIVLHRLWTTSHPDILIAPKWNVLPGELSLELQARMEELGLEQGCCS